MNEVIENKTKGELEEEKTVKRKDKWKIEKREYEKWNEKIEIRYIMSGNRNRK